MSKNVIIIGASGHGKVVADIIRKSGDVPVGFLDDADILPEEICGIPVLGKIASYRQYPDAWFVIAIGNSVVRRKIADSTADARWYTAVHPSAVVSDMEVSIGGGTVVMANAVINPCAKIGCHCIINTGAIVEHENNIGDFTHISVGAKLAGNVHVGESTWIGIGAVVSNNIEVCRDCVIGASAVVTHDIKEPGTYVGVPARKIK